MAGNFLGGNFLGRIRLKQLSQVCRPLSMESAEDPRQYGKGAVPYDRQGGGEQQNPHRC